MAKQKFSSAFKNIKVIGELPCDKVAKKLREMDDYYNAKKFVEEFKKRGSKEVSVRRYSDKVVVYRKYKPKKYKPRYKPKRKVSRKEAREVYTEEVPAVEYRDRVA